MEGVHAVEARIAAIQARFAFTGQWVFDPEIEPPYRTGGLYVGSSLDDATPGAGDGADALEPFGEQSVTRLAEAADVADPATAEAQQRLLGSTYGIGTSTLVPDDGAWIRRLPEDGRTWAGVIADAARANGLEPELLAAVAWTESGFDQDAVASSGATGLLQLLPSTADRLGVDPSLPLDNLAGGARELRRLLDAADGRLQEALAAYHAGEDVGLGRRDLWSAATTAYVATVLERRDLVVTGRTT